MNQEFLWSILFCNLIGLPIYLFFRYRKYKRVIIINKRTYLKKEVVLLILFVYLICLIAITLIPLPCNKAYAGYLNLDPFGETYRNFVSSYNHTSERTIWREIENLLGNIVLFFPLGFLLPCVYSKVNKIFYIFCISFALSFCIEAEQYLISIKYHYGRLSDIDDIILNTIGGCLGFLVYWIFKPIINKYFNKNK